jgi:hypothetical protein
MKTPEIIPLAKTTITTMAEIKAAAEAFDQGETNVFDALDAILMAVEAYRSQSQPRRDAA